MNTPWVFISPARERAVAKEWLDLLPPANAAAILAAHGAASLSRLNSSRVPSVIAAVRRERAARSATLPVAAPTPGAIPLAGLADAIGAAVRVARERIEAEDGAERIAEAGERESKREAVALARAAYDAAHAKANAADKARCTADARLTAALKTQHGVAGLIIAAGGYREHPEHALACRVTNQAKEALAVAEFECEAAYETRSLARAALEEAEAANVG